MPKQIVNALQPGTVLRGKTYNYTIERALGQGTFGITYLAKLLVRGELGEIETNTRVAVKEFFMHEVNGREQSAVTSGSRGGIFDNYRHKFIREARSLGRLRHKGIIKVLEQFEANNTVYYAMEYVSGGSLDDYIRSRGTLSEQETLAIAAKIEAALAYMHSQSMLHLDLKPANVMMKDGEPVLIDFGLAKHFDTDGLPESSTSIGAGTPGYAPLEQANFTGRTADGTLPAGMDIYALGATMFKMLTGTRPPLASDILNDGFPRRALELRHVSKPTIDLIESRMSPTKNKRPKLRAEAAETEDENTDFTDRGEKKEEVHKEVWYKRPAVKLIACVACCLLVGAAFLWNSNSEQPAAAPQNKSQEVSVSGSIAGHDYVDLGLSVKWATCNVGATSPEQYGDYFAWGETKPNKSYDWQTCSVYGKDIGDISGNPDYDAARANWGGTWRLPTSAEIKELLQQCTYTWTNRKGVQGYVFESRINGNTIFLPAAGYYEGTLFDKANSYGYYWSGTSFGGDALAAGILYFTKSGGQSKGILRYRGQSVRPVAAP